MTWIVGGLAVGVGLTWLALWIGVRLAERKHQQDISPAWLNEHAYDDGKDGDNEWGK
jgi:hypothetical protein